MSIIRDESSFPDDPRLTKIVEADSNQFIGDELSRKLPSKIGRYKVVQLLGQGGLCSVLLGHDTRLERHVAIKIPRVDRQVDEAVWRELLHEARSLAKLRHESIISVIDVELEKDGTPYVVMEFVDGTNLHNFWSRKEFDLRLALRIILQIAGGLKFIHDHGIVHRDLKPTNIIIDRHQNARIADFGLALELNSIDHSRRKSSIAGTSKFMSPEQLSGESHRIDERTDLWGLGVVLYWMCTGSYPFDGSNFDELQKQIKTQSQQHLDHCNSHVPEELDRICRKCLSELMHDRYSSAEAVIEDLESLESACFSPRSSANFAIGNVGIGRDVSANELVGNKQSISVIPKCLQPYDENDAAFFLELLPGPKDRLGHPDCLRFWISRFNGMVGHCSHGLLYGPSGCGKTSFLKAGLFPRLPDSIEIVYLDCLPQQTEHGLFSLLSDQLRVKGRTELGLHDLVRQIREGEHLPSHRRLLIVLDHFEQFLANSSDFASSELVAALRHCDGNRISCLISVRDDYWMPTQEFLRLQEVRIQDGRNAQAFQLFDEKHAHKVLNEFGKAYGSIPLGGDASQLKQQRFTTRAITAIAENGKVNCGHLAILASVVNSQAWSEEMLEKLGGWHGVVIRFMNQRFSFETAPISRRLLLPQILAIVNELIPPAGSRVKAISKPTSELIVACPAGTTAEAFQDAITTLERECHFIKPVFSIPGAASDSSSGQRFQLTNDILAEPLRQWVRQEQKQNWQGRAQAELKELAEIWSTDPEQVTIRPLPSVICMKMATRRRLLDPIQSKFLSNALRFRLAKYGLAAAILVSLACVAAFWYQHSEAHRQNQVLYANYLASPSEEVAGFLDELASAQIDLAEVSPQFELASQREQFRDSLAKYEIQGKSANDETRLLQLAGNVAAEEHVNVIRALKPTSDSYLVSLSLKSAYEHAESIDARNKYAILALELGDSSLVNRIIQDAEFDPTQLTHLRHRFLEIAVLPEAAIAERILSEAEELQVQLLLLSALYLDDGPNEVPNEIVQDLLDFSRNLYASCPDSYAHSVAKWVLEKNSVELPKIETSATNHWQVLDQGITLINVDGGSISIDRETDERREILVDAFMAADLEITLGQFREFLKDETYVGEKPQEVPFDPSTVTKPRTNTWELDKSASPTWDHPVVRVSALHAAMFCNWLSTKNDLEPVYVFVDPFQFTSNPASNGFRLPTDAEMTYMIRSGYSCPTFLGEGISTDWIRHYASFEDFVENEMRRKLARLNFRGGINLPNRWGLFDIVGSVSELCVDHCEGHLLVQELGYSSSEPAIHVFRGNPASTRRNPTSVNSKAGFRVVRNE